MSGSDDDLADQDTAQLSATRILEATQSWSEENEGQGCPSVSQLVEEEHLSKKARTDDPWGGRFRVVCEGDTIVIRSPGRDGKLGTPDDVRVPAGV